MLISLYTALLLAEDDRKARRLLKGWVNLAEKRPAGTKIVTGWSSNTGNYFIGLI